MYELFYAIIPTLFPRLFADVLSLHLVTFLMFFNLVCTLQCVSVNMNLIIADL